MHASDWLCRLQNENRNQSDMTQRSNSAISMLIALVSVAPIFCSCTVQDSAYAAGSSRVADVDFSANHIVGVWAEVSARPRNPARDETKSYYQFEANGRGVNRQYSLFRATGHSVSMEAPIKWRYLGSNRWQIMLPPSTAYRVIENQGGVSVGYIGARDFIARYSDGKLYCIVTIGSLQGGSVLVRATRENVAEAANRARSEHPVLGLGGGIIQFHRAD